MTGRSACGPFCLPGDRPPACPGCGQASNHPPSLDHEDAVPWWCSACLTAKVKAAR